MSDIFLALLTLLTKSVNNLLITMFEQLRAEDKAERLKKASGKYTEGINLYKAFINETQDKPRAQKLALKLDSYYNSLTKLEQEEYAALLVQNGLINPKSPLGQVIMTFNASLVNSGVTGA